MCGRAAVWAWFMLMSGPSGGGLSAEAPARGRVYSNACPGARFMLIEFLSLLSWGGPRGPGGVPLNPPVPPRALRGPAGPRRAPGWRRRRGVRDQAAPRTPKRRGPAGSWRRRPCGGAWETPRRAPLRPHGESATKKAANRPQIAALSRQRRRQRGRAAPPAAGNPSPVPPRPPRRREPPHGPAAAPPPPAPSGPERAQN